MQALNHLWTRAYPFPYDRYVLEVSTSSGASGAKVPKRALIFAGGGMKVAFQAGVLQVLLDEAQIEGKPIDFEIADGCSGGVFNLAMWCEGRSGKEIADAWRDFPAKRGVGLNWRKYWKLFRADSLLSMDRFRKNILDGHWHLDWDQIRNMGGKPGRVATFNAFDFTHQKLVTREASQVDEDFLVAGVALPGWFPSAEIDCDTYIDPVFVTDANVEEAIERGATELWVIWTVSTRGKWRNGFTGNYFGIIETAANGEFARVCERIERSNAALARGDHSQYPHRIDLKVIKGEVPLHYLLNVNSDRFTQAVELGVSAGRQWCLKQQDPPITVTPTPPDDDGTVTSVNFGERMEGFMSPGATGYRQGYEAGKDEENSVVLQMKIEIETVDDFISDPEHEATLTGDLQLGTLGGAVKVDDGRFNLMPFEGDFDERWMFYWLPFAADGEELVLCGYKWLLDQSGQDLWGDATTLFTHLLEDAPRQPPPVEELIERFREGEPAAGTVRAAGIVRIDFPSFMRLLSNMSATGPTKRAEFAGKMRFCTFFVGGLWDAYASRALSASPF